MTQYDFKFMEAKIIKILMVFTLLTKAKLDIVSEPLKRTQETKISMIVFIT